MTKLLIVNTYVGNFKYSGTTANTSGDESKYRIIAVPRIIIADIVYDIDDNLCILYGSSLVINRRDHNAGKFLCSPGVGAASSDILSTPPSMLEDEDRIVLSSFCSSNNNNSSDDCCNKSSSTEGFVYECNGDGE